MLSMKSLYLFIACFVLQLFRVMWNNGRTKIVDNEIVHKICFSSTRLGSGISYLVSKKDIAEH